MPVTFASHLAILLTGLSRRQSKVSTPFECKINGHALGGKFGHSTAVAGRTGKQEHRELRSLSRQQYQGVTTYLNYEELLPLLQCLLSSRVRKVLMLCKFGAERPAAHESMTTIYFLMRNLKNKPKQLSLISAIFFHSLVTDNWSLSRKKASVQMCQ